MPPSQRCLATSFVLVKFLRYCSSSATRWTEHHGTEVHSKSFSCIHHHQQGSSCKEKYVSALVTWLWVFGLGFLYLSAATFKMCVCALSNTHEYNSCWWLSVLPSTKNGLIYSVVGKMLIHVGTSCHLVLGRRCNLQRKSLPGTSSKNQYQMQLLFKTTFKSITSAIF